MSQYQLTCYCVSRSSRLHLALVWNTTNTYFFFGSKAKPRQHPPILSVCELHWERAAGWGGQCSPIPPQHKEGPSWPWTLRRGRGMKDELPPFRLVTSAFLMVLPFLSSPSLPCGYQLSFLSGHPSDWHKLNCPHPYLPWWDCCFCFRPDEVLTFPKAGLFFSDILFCLMKDATSAYISSTLLGEDMLRYNLPPFLSETHLLYLLSSIQRHAFSERTGFLPSSWKEHPCSVSTASEILGCWKSPYHTVRNSNGSPTSSLENQAECLLPAEIWGLPTAKVGDSFQSSGLAYITAKLIPVRVWSSDGQCNWTTAGLLSEKCALPNATKITTCWGHKVHKTHFVLSFVSLTADSVMLLFSLPLFPAVGRPYLHGAWPVLLLFFSTKCWSRAEPAGRQETEKRVGEGGDCPEKRSCQCLRVGVWGKGEAVPSPPVLNVPHILPWDEVSQEGFRCPGVTGPTKQ